MYLFLCLQVKVSQEKRQQLGEEIRSSVASEHGIDVHHLVSHGASVTPMVVVSVLVLLAAAAATSGDRSSFWWCRRWRWLLLVLLLLPIC